MFLEISVGDSLCAAFVRVFTGRHDLLELLGQQWVWIDKFHGRRAAGRADDLELTLDQLVNVVVDALLAEAFPALAALAGIQHDILAEEAVEEGVILDNGRRTRAPRNFDLIFVQCHLAPHDERTRV